MDGSVGVAVSWWILVVVTLIDGNVKWCNWLLLVVVCCDGS